MSRSRWRGVLIVLSLFLVNEASCYGEASLEQGSWSDSGSVRSDSGTSRSDSGLTRSLSRRSKLRRPRLGKRRFGESSHGGVTTGDEGTTSSITGRKRVGSLYSSRRRRSQRSQRETEPGVGTITGVDTTASQEVQQVADPEVATWSSNSRSTRYGRRHKLKKRRHFNDRGDSESVQGLADTLQQLEGEVMVDPAGKTSRSRMSSAWRRKHKRDSEDRPGTDATGETAAETEARKEVSSLGNRGFEARGGSHLQAGEGEGDSATGNSRAQRVHRHGHSEDGVSGRRYRKHFDASSDGAAGRDEGEGTGSRTEASAGEGEEDKDRSSLLRSSILLENPTAGEDTDKSTTGTGTEQSETTETAAVTDTDTSSTDSAGSGSDSTEKSNAEGTETASTDSTEATSTDSTATGAAAADAVTDETTTTNEALSQSEGTEQEATSTETTASETSTSETEASGAESTTDGASATNADAETSAGEEVALAKLPELTSAGGPGSRNAYVSILYVGTARDYEYFIGLRVTLLTVKRTGTSADLVVIASANTPARWKRTLASDGFRVIEAPNLENPYKITSAYNPRFRFVLNKLLAWGLTEYTRVVLLDADNIVLMNMDELFLCGEFCAVFLNPCIFHTGLVVLKPSKKTFRSMLRQLAALSSFDAADQGFLASYYPSLLGSPLFVPPWNDSDSVSPKPLTGLYRLPMGYQMDAIYYNLKFKWYIPCSANKVITFPGVSSLKPWYWWTWPLFPLAIQWHAIRLSTIGYSWESSFCTILGVLWLAVLFSGKIKTSLSVSLQRQSGGSKIASLLGFLALFGVRYVPHALLHPPASNSNFLSKKWVRASLTMTMVLASFLLSFALIPATSHPFAGWILLFLGTFSLLRFGKSIFCAPQSVYWLPAYLCFSIIIMALPIYSALAMKLVVFYILAFGGGGVAVLVYHSIVSSDWSKVVKADLGDVDHSRIE